MKVVFRTNLDLYKEVRWPVLDASCAPQKGELVYVYPGSESLCKALKIPPRLEVSQRYFYHDRIEVELWYNETDMRSYTFSYGKRHLFGH